MPLMMGHPATRAQPTFRITEDPADFRTKGQELYAPNAATSISGLGEQRAAAGRRELAFYDAVAANGTAQSVMGDEVLAGVARELVARSAAS
jgi:hypothetical protein